MSRRVGAGGSREERRRGSAAPGDGNGRGVVRRTTCCRTDRPRGRRRAGDRDAAEGAGAPRGDAAAPRVLRVPVRRRRPAARHPARGGQADVPRACGPTPSAATPGRARTTRPRSPGGPAFELGLGVADLRPALPGYRYRAEFRGVVENEICPVYLGPVHRHARRPTPSEVGEWELLDWAAFRRRQETEGDAWSPVVSRAGPADRGRRAGPRRLTAEGAGSGVGDDAQPRRARAGARARARASGARP